MGDYLEEECSQYKSSLNGFDQDEPSHTWSDEEAGNNGTWSHDDYSNSAMDMTLLEEYQDRSHQTTF